MLAPLNFDDLGFVVRERGPMIAALFVEVDGVYADQPSVNVWDANRDARQYSGPWPVVAHPPCARWGRYATRAGQRVGDDGGCFGAALSAVQEFGGVLEHPADSAAFIRNRLPIPFRAGGWSMPDPSGGRSCCVYQGHYGHRAAKATWLYAAHVTFPDLIWGPAKKRLPIPENATQEQRQRLIRTGVCQRLSKKQRAATPEPFRDLLLSIARSVRRVTGCVPPPESQP